MFPIPESTMIGGCQNHEVLVALTRGFRRAAQNTVATGSPSAIAPA
jgi:hypothetical protein